MFRTADIFAYSVHYNMLIASGLSFAFNTLIVLYEMKFAIWFVLSRSTRFIEWKS